MQYGIITPLLPLSTLLCAVSAMKPSAAGLRAVHLGASSHYGNSKCPCVGLDNVKGEIAMADGDTKLMYPAETGASCVPWDSKSHPTCESGSEAPDWCKQSWCYVDPCKCDISELPKVSSFLPNANYQGKPVYYSYATCGSVDTWTETEHQAACVNQKTEADCSQLGKCGWDGRRCGGKEALGECKKTLDKSKYGEENCRCVGIDNVEGTIDATIDDGTQLKFPADWGATCQRWEAELHPDCKGDKPPEWCDKSWCLVDPCSCGQVEPPKVSEGWLGKTVKFQGKTPYYSYTTCGSKDLFTAGYHKAACVNQKSEAACSALDSGKCAWTGTRCLGKELAESCPGLRHSSAHAVTPLLVLALLLVCQV